MVDLSSLADLPSQTEGWRPLERTDLTGPHMEVLCFDQSLKATGYVWLRRSPHLIQIMQAETFVPPASDLVSFEDDYAKALWMEDHFERVLCPYGSNGLRSPRYPVRIVHETPAVSNPQMRKKLGSKAGSIGVASRMSGRALRSAAHHLGLDEHVRMVNSQQSKKIVCGDARADKKQAHDALKALTWIEGLDLLTNEAKRDAALLGINILKREHHQ